ncbi:unnamed protein product [Schistosoma margrebowiei]|uniref:Uncharacterized protein n=1 Tax=Schistosoma margrebowiei TaxID=48269 RepID=A0A183ML05_9TREM|nr:unnamed protein product [Schistosoma margrebowiei]
MDLYGNPGQDPKKKKKTAMKNSRTRTEEVKARVKYTEANRQVKRSIGCDKQKYVEDLPTTVEKGITEGNMK